MWEKAKQYKPHCEGIDMLADLFAEKAECRDAAMWDGKQRWPDCPLTEFWRRISFVCRNRVEPPHCDRILFQAARKAYISPMSAGDALRRALSHADSARGGWLQQSGAWLVLWEYADTLDDALVRMKTGAIRRACGNPVAFYAKPNGDTILFTDGADRIYAQIPVEYFDDSDDRLLLGEVSLG